jgi:hypothetical protein
MFLNGTLMFETLTSSFYIINVTITASMFKSFPSQPPRQPKLFLFAMVVTVMAAAVGAG